MVRPLDVAWSILKFDFHMGSNHSGHFQSEPDNDYGPKYAKYASDMYGPTGMAMRERLADFPELKPHPLFMEGLSGRRMSEERVNYALERLPFNSDLPHLLHQKGPADTPNFPRPRNDKFGRYHRGGSVPRLHEDGTYAGVRLNQDIAEDFEEDFDKGAEQIGNIGAHENVHRLIDDEMEQWAKEQTDIEALKREQQENIARLTQQYPPLKPHPFGLTEDEAKASFATWPEPETSYDVLVRAGLKPDPYGDEEYPETFNDMDVERAQGSFSPLRSIGHEFGAYSLTPDSSSPTGFMTPEKRFDKMGNPNYTGAEFYHPDPELRSDFSELHLAGPSEDQVRYEQMLQEQQAAGDVNPQTSVQ